MFGSVRRRVAAALISAAAAVLTTLAVAPPASAATQGWVYVAAPTWLGNCAAGKNGKVTGLLASAGNTWSTTRWDRGDDRVYAKVNLNQTQQFSYEAFCNKPWPGSYQPGVAQMIRPTRNGQTISVGPLGVRY